MKSTFFITGTDTAVGKTLVTTAILHAAKLRAKTAFAIKPMAAGCVSTDSGPQNEDAVAIMAHNSVALSYQQVNPIALMAAKAPHIAAAEEGRRLSLSRIEGLVRGALMTRADLRLVEGAGGWRIPLSSTEDYAQLPKALAIPVILVVGMRLGCLNHALLTAEAITRDGLTLAGWVANGIDRDMPSLQDNINTLKHCLPAPCLGEIPWLDNVNAEQASNYIKFDRLQLPERME